MRRQGKGITGCLGGGAGQGNHWVPGGNHWVLGGGGKGFEVVYQQQPTGGRARESLGAWGRGQGKGIAGCLGEGARDLRWYTSNNPLGEEAGQGNHWVPGGGGRARESLGAWGRGQGKGITGCLGEGAGQGNHWVPGGGGRARESLGAWGRGQGKGITGCLGDGAGQGNHWVPGGGGRARESLGAGKGIEVVYQ